MNRTKHYLTPLLFLCLVGLMGSTAARGGAESAEENKQYLAAYEKIHAALVQDNLVTAKAAAADLGEAGTLLAQSGSLKEARAAFEKLSAEARIRSAGQSGYHTFHCPMLKKDWVQNSTTVANPYGGKEMVTCGEILK